MNFTQHFSNILKNKNSLLCVGLDPDIEKMPEFIRSEPDPLFQFCSQIVESTQEFAAAFKINFAFFEAHGSKGWVQLEQLAKLLPDDCLKIADAKRADIGNTSAMYAKSVFEHLDFDAVTVNPYMGTDSVAPFLQQPEKGAFILCVTSNPGSKDFQRLPVESTPLYQKVIAKVEQWNQNGNCGLVVGATHPDELTAVRQLAPDLPFLIPGIGAQGGDIETAVRSGGLAVFNASRSILYKSQGEDFAEAAASEARRLRDAMNHVGREA